MAKVWKVLALLAVVTALVWVSTLWRWQSAQVDPDTAQLMVHLALLPLALTASLLAVVWGVKRIGRYSASPIAPAAPAGSSARLPAASPVAAVSAARSAPQRVLAAAVQCRAGAAWQDAQTRIVAGDCKAELDADMKDDEGIAIFTAPMADISTDRVAASLEDTVATHAAALREQPLGHPPQPEVLRALALLESIVHRLCGELESQWAALSVPPPAARAPMANQAVLAPVVRLHVALPARWPEEVRQLATVWLQELLAPHVDAGLRAAGQSRAMAGAGAASPAVQLQVQPVESAQAHWLLVEQQLRQWQRERQPGLLLAMAADSLIGEEAVSHLAQDHQLFSSRHQQGRIPGEGAAGLLIASDTWPSPADTVPLALMHPASIVKRDKSADASGQINSQVLVQALDDTLHGTGIDAAAIKFVTTDADHRASRTVEVYETLLERMPHLDDDEHALQLGRGCGDMGIAGLLACVALTAAQVQEALAPALVVGAQSPFDRLTMLLAPATAPAAAHAVQPQPA